MNPRIDPRKMRWLLLGLACAAVMLPNLGYPLMEPDETRYVQIALEMRDHAS